MRLTQFGITHQRCLFSYLLTCHISKCTSPVHFYITAYACWGSRALSDAKERQGWAHCDNYSWLTIFPVSILTNPTSMKLHCHCAAFRLQKHRSPFLIHPSADRPVNCSWASGASFSIEVSGCWGVLSGLRENGRSKLLNSARITFIGDSWSYLISLLFSLLFSLKSDCSVSVLKSRPPFSKVKKDKSESHLEIWKQPPHLEFCFAVINVFIYFRIVSLALHHSEGFGATSCRTDETLL